MIDPQTAWLIIKQNANKALKTNLQWHSLVQGKQYKLKAVLDDRIVIEREGEGSSEELTSARVFEAANYFNSQNFMVERGTLISPTVAQETAFVLFHPQLTWDEENRYIIQQ
jgi:hypothetical protein